MFFSFNLILSFFSCSAFLRRFGSENKISGIIKVKIFPPPAQKNWSDILENFHGDHFKQDIGFGDDTVVKIPHQASKIHLHSSPGF